MCLWKTNSNSLKFYCYTQRFLNTCYFTFPNISRHRHNQPVHHYYFTIPKSQERHLPTQLSTNYSYAAEPTNVMQTWPNDAGHKALGRGRALKSAQQPASSWPRLGVTVL